MTNKEQRGEIIGKMNTFLEEIRIWLALWLLKVLPLITKNWWEECVLSKLTEEQRYRTTEHGRLDKLDLPSLLNVTISNWQSIRRVKPALGDTENGLFRDIRTMRNRWGHIIEPNPEKIKEWAIIDLKKIVLFYEQMAPEEKDALSKVEKLLRELLGDPPPPPPPLKTGFFYVFQNMSFDCEFSKGILWAPSKTSTGRTVHHWDRMMDIEIGDIIFHGVRGVVQAISIATSKWEPAPQPSWSTGEYWTKEGRQVNVDYVHIHNPIKTSDFKQEILKYRNDRYSAFNKQGTGNQGYLFSLEEKLAKLFFEETKIKNPSLENDQRIAKIAEAFEDKV